MTQVEQETTDLKQVEHKTVNYWKNNNADINQKIARRYNTIH